MSEKSIPICSIFAPMGDEGMAPLSLHFKNIESSLEFANANS